MIPWKILITVPAVAFVAALFAYLGQTEVAAAAAGALIGYLGKVNGQSGSGNGS